MRIALGDNPKSLFSKENSSTSVFGEFSFIDIPLLERLETKKVVRNSEWRKESAKPQRE